MKLAKLKDVKAFELLIPYSHLGVGKSFGDLALQINEEYPHRLITRAASV